jgi:dTDP-4-dehydrorhamnose 3,5-epimerase-like enzyme
MLIRKCVQKLRLSDRGGSRFAGDIEIEVASEHDRGAYVVSPGILQGLLNLGAAQRIIALTLQVRVISDKPFPSNGTFRMSFQSLQRSWFLEERVSREARL